MDRAIVSTTPGTTRDVLEESVNILGVCVRLVDTAGLRQTKNPLESEGIRRTTQAVDQAAMLLIVLDGSQDLTQDEVQLLNDNFSKKKIVILNKSDLPAKTLEST